MGLLEDAIREHLELKRQQGADPGEIAQKEREALEPVVPDEPATWGLEHDPTVQSLAGEYEQPAPEAAEPALPTASFEDRAMDVSSVGQETAEIDMREVFGELGEIEQQDPYPLGLGATAPVRAARITGQPRGETFDWQSPEDAPVEQIPGQESLAFE